MSAMTTIRDLWTAYSEACGAETPARTLDELRDEFHARGFVNYEREGQTFLDAIFADGWAFAALKEDDMEKANVRTYECPRCNETRDKDDPTTAPCARCGVCAECTPCAEGHGGSTVCRECEQAK